MSESYGVGRVKTSPGNQYMSNEDSSSIQLEPKVLSKLSYRYSESIHDALLDLYLAIKIRKADEVDNLDFRAAIKEKTILKESK